MNCPIRNEESAGLLLAYTARRLDAGKAAMLERHMELCAQCAEFRSGQEFIWQALDAWEPATVTPDFNRRLYQRIEAESAAPWYRRLSSATLMGWKPAIPIAAACMVVVAGLVWDRPVANTPPATSPAIHSAAEAEQVEDALDDLQLLRQLDSGGVSGSSDSM